MLKSEKKSHGAVDESSSEQQFCKLDVITLWQTVRQNPGGFQIFKFCMDCIIRIFMQLQCCYRDMTKMQNGLEHRFAE